VDPSVPDRWWEPFRQVNGAGVIHVDLVPHERREAAGLAWLDSAERSRSERFQHAPARRRFVLCRAALRSLLCTDLGCDNAQLSFGTADGGKPFALLDGRPVDVGFNVSHSGRHGLIALAPGGRVGGDLEERVPRHDFDRLTEAVFGPDERADLAAVAGDARTRLFYRLWTLKEAAAKALGTGLSFDVSRFEIPAAIRSGKSRGVLRIPEISEARLRLTAIDDRRFAAALAQEAHETADRGATLSKQRADAAVDCSEGSCALGIPLDRAGSLSASQERGPTMATTEERVRALVDANLDVEGRTADQPLTMDLSIVDAGVSSTDVVAFWRVVCEEFGVDISAEDFAELLTPGDLIAHLDAHAG